MAAQSTSKPQSVEIKLAGQKIVLKASEADPELVREIVELVSVKIKNAEKRGKGNSPHQVALVALLDLAEEYIKAKRRTFAFKREMNDRSENLMKILDSEFGA
jgi:cell division protein ZapA (FtsZ GTPase activity inhibitor)